MNHGLIESNDVDGPWISKEKKKKERSLCFSYRKLKLNAKIKNLWGPSTKPTNCVGLGTITYLKSVCIVQ